MTDHLTTEELWTMVLIEDSNRKVVLSDKYIIVYDGENLENMGMTPMEVEVKGLAPHRLDCITFFDKTTGAKLNRHPNASVRGETS